MTMKRNIILALILTLGITSVLYAEKGKRRNNRNAKPRGKGKPAMQAPRAPQPRAQRPKPNNAPRRGAKPRNDTRFVGRHPAKIRPVAKPRPPRRPAPVMRVVRPRPVREIIKVVNVYPRIQPYCVYNDRVVFNVTIVNQTGRKIELELDGSHEGDDDIGKLHPGEVMQYPLVVKSKKLPETFELEAGSHELEFTLNHCSPRELEFVITPYGICMN